MVRLHLLVVYFGPFPPYIKRWLESCRANPTINWTVVTDNEPPGDLPGNVRFHYETFAQVGDRVASVFPHKIILDRPYKLCDFRPAYGEVFADLLTECDFWGYCDTDTIWGNLRVALPKAILDVSDKVFAGGHFTLLRNTDEVTTLYRRAAAEAPRAYRRAFQTSGTYAFDEWGLHNDGINVMLQRGGKSLYLATMPYADIKPHTYGLRTTREEFGDLADQEVERSKRNILYVWDRGRLEQYFLDPTGTVGRHEEAYIHLQKRRIRDMAGGDFDRFAIAPPGVLRPAPEGIDADYLKRFARERWFYPQRFRLKLNGLRSRLERHLA